MRNAVEKSTQGPLDRPTARSGTVFLERPQGLPESGLVEAAVFLVSP